MEASLLYHSDQADDVSPFDKAILRVSAKGAVCMVCPYIQVAYLRRIVDRAESWRLVSDIEAWMMSVPARGRSGTYEFIKANISRIHNVPNLHAKAVIGVSSAYLGSANLTRSGILLKTELGVLIESKPLLIELAAWFEELWMGSAPPRLEETLSLVEATAQIVAEPRFPRYRISTKTGGIRARLLEDSAAKAIGENHQPVSLEWAVIQAAIADMAKDEDYALFIRRVVQRFAAGSSPFSFADIATMPSVERLGLRLRDIYAATVRLAANHYSTAYLDEAEDIVVIRTDGKFEQCNESNVLPSIAQYDQLLFAAIEHFGFGEAAAKQSKAHLPTAVGVGVQSMEVIIETWLEVGLLRTLDRPGALPNFYLDQKFEWPTRYVRFPLSCRRWQSKLEAYWRNAAEEREAAGATREQLPVAIQRKSSPQSQGANHGRTLLERLTQNQGSKRVRQRDEALRAAVRLFSKQGSSISVEQLVEKMQYETRIDVDDAITLLAKAVDCGMFTSTDADNGAVFLHVNTSFDPSSEFKDMPMARVAWTMIRR